MLLRSARLFGALLLVSTCSVLGAAQEEHHHHESTEQIGKVHFAVSCSPRAQIQFNVAVAWLHSFEYGDADRAFKEVVTIDPHCAMAWDEQLHAMDYLAYAYLQQARDSEARAVLDELKSIRKTEPENFKCAFSFAAIPARWALERRKWAEAAELKIEPADFPWSRFLQGEAITHFARAIGAARSGDIDHAKREVAKLAQLQKALTAVKDNYDWATQVAIQHKAASAWLARAEGRNQEALQLMRAAADLEDSTDKHPVTPGAVVPAREMLGDLLLELNQPSEALKEHECSLLFSPNRFNGLYGAARAAELAGNRVKARLHYQRLVDNCKAVDSNRPELERAKEFLRQSQRPQAASATSRSRIGFKKGSPQL